MPSLNRLREPLTRLWRRLRGGATTPGRAAISVALGVFIGCLPLFGLHFALCSLICLPLRLDLVTCYLAANISNPLLAPALIAVELELGSWLLHGQTLSWDRSLATTDLISRFALELAVGAPLVGLLLAGVFGGLTFGVVRARSASARPALRAAIARCQQRYAAAPRGVRYFVRGKLRYDPISAALTTWGQLGEVVDLGCGRGQLSLLALELGQATRVRGYDIDAQKVEFARQAALVATPLAARFEVLNLAATRGPDLSCDTILLLDVLHYLPLASQDSLLRSCAEQLRPGGRLILREAVVRPTPRSGLTRLAERLGSKLGVNQASGMFFRDPTELMQRLASLALSPALSQGSAATPLDNQLIIASKPRVAVERAP